MVKVITYGTFDLLHHGHIKLLERAKALGDYLIVGITADDFDKTRGKINVQQPLMERIDSVKATGLADEIIVEEYEGQKIDDIQRYGINIFTVGSDWEGKFDYLNEYCNVIYLPRTQGISSSDLRAKQRQIQLGLVGESPVLHKFIHECKNVNGIEIKGLCSGNQSEAKTEFPELSYITDNYCEFLQKVDAVYIVSHPVKHYSQIKEALDSGKHVLCESPIAISEKECAELFDLAAEKGLILMEGLKTAYSTAYSRLLLLLKSDIIGKIVSIDATCTSIRGIEEYSPKQLSESWNSICAWGPVAMLPIFQLLGTGYTDKKIISSFADSNKSFDSFTKVNFTYPKAVASILVGKGIKSEGELIISGTKGYVYVPAPWWKMDYFEVRYENPADNKRFFYQLDGEGLQYEAVAFVRAIESGKTSKYISLNTSKQICSVIEDFFNKKDCVEI